MTGIEENMQAGILIDGPNQIPGQKMTLFDRGGRTTPHWLRIGVGNHTDAGG